MIYIYLSKTIFIEGTLHANIVLNPGVPVMNHTGACTQFREVNRQYKSIQTNNCSIDKFYEEK